MPLSLSLPPLCSLTEGGGPTRGRVPGHESNNLFKPYELNYKIASCVRSKHGSQPRAYCAAEDGGEEVSPIP